VCLLFAALTLETFFLGAALTTMVLGMKHRSLARTELERAKAARIAAETGVAAPAVKPGSHRFVLVVLWLVLFIVFVLLFIQQGGR
jgi:hypothetical protein